MQGRNLDPGRRWRSAAAATLVGIVSLGACERSPSDALENATPSPNASILPAPLSSLGQPAAESPPQPPMAAHPGAPAESAGRLATGDGGGVPPQGLRSDEPPDDDPLPLRELPGVTLIGEWRYADLPAPAKAPEINAAGLEAARKLTVPRMTIDLASVGRMRVTLSSRGFSMPQGAEIRGRIDRYGHVLVWPNGSRFRVLPPGAVRTLFAERRADAIPLVRPQSGGRSDGARRLGFVTKKWELTTRTGKMVLEQAKMAGAGEGGTLLCRFLSEIVAIDPSAAPCAADDVPLRAMFTWPQGGSIAFEITALTDKAELSSIQLGVPPSGSEFAPQNLPPSPNDQGGALLSREELAAFRLRALDSVAPSSSLSPPEGLLLHNATDLLRYAFVDSVPVAWVLPNREQLVMGLLRGRYLVQWRTFLGDAIDPPVTVEIPLRLAIGVPSEGTRDR